MSPRQPQRSSNASSELRVRHAADLVELIRSTPKPADFLVAGHFKENARLTGDDRRVIVEWVYAVLRHALYLSELARGADFPPSRTVYAALFLTLRARRDIDPNTVRETLSAVSRVNPKTFDTLATFASRHRDLDFVEGELERFALRRAFRPWVAERLLAVRPRAEVATILEGLNSPPLTCLRVNTLKTSRDELRETLRGIGINTRLGRYAPDALVVRESADLFATEAFRDGLFEIQDEGSQVISLLVGARPGARVLDACAGACGKTLHLGALMKGRGEVYAYDTDARRLANGVRRVQRSGLQNVRVLDSPERFEAFEARQAGAVDAVLIDAPCTGLGTVRRSPDIKLRATPERLEELNVKQREILKRYAEFLKPGGRLVYATCSILEEENGRIVEEFLSADSDFRLLPVSELVAALPPEIASDALREAALAGETLQLYPHLHGTDGFYAAVLERA